MNKKTYNFIFISNNQVIKAKEKRWSCKPKTDIKYLMTQLYKKQRVNWVTKNTTNVYDNYNLL